MADHREYFNRKLHSLLVVIPVGVFLIVHLVVNHYATRGEEAYNKAAGFMGNLPFQILLEIFIIFLPLAYHAIYGVYIAFTAKNNVTQYGYLRNWFFLLQRVTGIITFVFIVWHVWQTRIQVAMYGTEVNFQMMEGILANPVALWLYIIGVLSAIFHFANGLWSFCVTWGITLSPRSQVITTYITMGIFVAMSIVGIRAILAFI